MFNIVLAIWRRACCMLCWTLSGESPDAYSAKMCEMQGLPPAAPTILNIEVVLKACALPCCACYADSNSLQYSAPFAAPDVSSLSCQMLLQELLPLLEVNLSNPSQAMRVATLRLLCCFDQPSMPSSAATPKGSTGEPSQALSICLGIQTQAFSAESGRQAAVAVGKLQNQLEYSQMPLQLIRPVVQGIIGILHIR